MNDPSQNITVPDNTAMRCILEEMRNNPGSISSSAAAGAAHWALERIEWLEREIANWENAYDWRDE